VSAARRSAGANRHREIRHNPRAHQNALLFAYPDAPRASRERASSLPRVAATLGVLPPRTSCAALHDLHSALLRANRAPTTPPSGYIAQTRAQRANASSRESTTASSTTRTGNLDRSYRASIRRSSNKSSCRKARNLMRSRALVGLDSQSDSSIRQETRQSL